MQVLDYLKNKSVTDLVQENSLRVTPHPTLPLTIYNYDQIDSPRTGPARDCRSLVLDNNGKLVSRSFSRFFNIGEFSEELNEFNWSNGILVQEKLDGSLISFFYYDGWHVRTRGSWANDNMQFQDFTWKDAILKALDLGSLDQLDNYLDRRLTYVCEFCSPWNKIVRYYPNPVVYFLSAFEGATELHWEDDRVGYRSLHQEIFLDTPVYYLYSLPEIVDFIQKKESKDKTWEGCVIRDCKNRRWKLKSSNYVLAHKIVTGLTDKNLIEAIATGIIDEWWKDLPDEWFKEVREKSQIYKSQFHEIYEQAEQNFKYALKNSEGKRKAFAAIAAKTAYPHLLFKQLANKSIDKDIWKIIKEKLKK